ncbi:MAG: hypothetical protein KF773_21835 [Deltaproteobacteria bacterium]|nr:hypothetical protein [Deltaproteobacteria bacterium]
MLHRVVIVFGLVAWMVGTARAERRAVVIEAYVGERPTDAERVMKTLREELEKLNFVVSPEALEEALLKANMPPAINDGIGGDFEEQWKTAHDTAFTEGKWRELTEKLVPLIERARRNPGEFALDQTKREPLRRAVIDVAMAKAKLGDLTASKEWFRDVVSSFGDLGVPRGQHGGEAADAYDAVKRELGGKKGTIEVSCTEQAAIYINEHQIDIGTKVSRQFPPGRYRVFVKLGNQRMSRVRTVDIVDEQVAKVEIDTGLESALRASKDWFGLSLRSNGSRLSDEGTYAKKIANELTAAGVIVIGLDEQQAVLASLIALTDGRPLKRGMVGAGASEAELRKLARFVAGEAQPGGRVVDITPRPPAKPMWGGWKYLSGVAAVGAFAAGAYYLSIDGSCRTENVTPCPDLLNTRPQAYVAMGVGVALVGLTVYLYIKGRPEKTPYWQKMSVVPAPGGGAMAGYTTTF